MMKQNSALQFPKGSGLSSRWRRSCSNSGERRHDPMTPVTAMQPHARTSAVAGQPHGLLHSSSGATWGELGQPGLPAGIVSRVLDEGDRAQLTARLSVLYGWRHFGQCWGSCTPCPWGAPASPEQGAEQSPPEDGEHKAEESLPPPTSHPSPGQQHLLYIVDTIYRILNFLPTSRQLWK